MRVGLIVEGDLEQATGGYLYDRMLIKELHRRGHESNILPLQRPALKGPAYSAGSTSLRSWMRGQDIIIQDGLCYRSLLGPNLSRKRPVVALMHNLSTCLDRPAAPAERRFLKSVDALICTSHATLRACRSLRPGLPSAVVAHPGKDHMMPCPRSPGETLRILHVGNIHPVKGLDVLLSALSDIAHLPFHLDVVGAVADEGFHRYLHEAMDDAIASRVSFLGAVQGDRMPELYRRADVVAIPARYEGFGIALLEAMGFGIPVISSREGGARELVTHGRDGFLVEPGDHGAVASHISALSDDTLREIMGRAARERWERHPTWGESMAVAVDLLESIVAGKDPDRSGRPRGTCP